jgi:hypothetical protein
MMHSKTTVVDGWWSRVGSTNLNISSLLLNWELDLIIEDRYFGAEMEQMYIDDLAHAREIILDNDEDVSMVSRVEPERLISHDEREAQRLSLRRGNGSRVIATAARISSAAINSGSKIVYEDERKVSIITSIAMIVFSLVCLLLPRYVAYLIGGLVLIFAIIRLLKIGQQPGN